MCFFFFHIFSCVQQELVVMGFILDTVNKKLPLEVVAESGLNDKYFLGSWIKLPPSHGMSGHGVPGHSLSEALTFPASC